MPTPTRRSSHQHPLVRRALGTANAWSYNVALLICRIRAALILPATPETAAVSSPLVATLDAGSVAGPAARFNLKAARARSFARRTPGGSLPPPSLQPPLSSTPLSPSIRTIPRTLMATGGGLGGGRAGGASGHDGTKARTWREHGGNNLRHKRGRRQRPRSMPPPAVPPPPVPPKAHELSRGVLASSAHPATSSATLLPLAKPPLPQSRSDVRRLKDEIMFM